VFGLLAVTSVFLVCHVNANNRAPGECPLIKYMYRSVYTMYQKNCGTFITVITLDHVDLF